MTRKPPAAIEELYQLGLQAELIDPFAPSDICEHMPILRELAEKCEHVTELGMRRANGSTVAFLAGQPETLVSYDLEPRYIVSTAVADLLNVAVVNNVWTGKIGRTTFQPRVGDSLKIVIEPTDLLFIDTWHVYKQLFAELMRHADPLERKVRKYIVLHDTFTFGWRGEDGSEPGLRTAAWHFQKQTTPTWGVKYDWSNNNGLTVLERADVSNEPGVNPDGDHPRFK